MKGKVDHEHYNYWEGWISDAFECEDFTSQNSMWMGYFIASEAIPLQSHRDVLKKILQSVYTSIPELTGILFLLSNTLLYSQFINQCFLFSVGGECDEEDEEYCFHPIIDFFQEVQEKNKEEVLQTVRGIHEQSRLFFSSRIIVLPFVEIRAAMQEDHDDLAAVFNSQSEVVTETFGEFFIAELIAAQNETRKALVAQVKNKTVGLLEITKEVDINLLHQCFQLESFDNLLKPEFMDAVRKRREKIIEDRLAIEEENRIEELKKLKEETMKCNRISQRIDLQEFCIRKNAEILAEIDGILNSGEENLKKLDRNTIDALLDKWLEGFRIRHPSTFFIDHPTDDTECKIRFV